MSKRQQIATSAVRSVPKHRHIVVGDRPSGLRSRLGWIFGARGNLAKERSGGVCPRCLAVVQMTFHVNVELFSSTFHFSARRVDQKDLIGQSICIEAFSWGNSSQDLSRVVSHGRRHIISIPPNENKTSSLLRSMVSDDSHSCNRANQDGKTKDHLSL
jgi:hypothetical protein